MEIIQARLSVSNESEFGWRYSKSADQQRIRVIEENIRSLKNEFENLKLEYEFLSSSERLLNFHKFYFKDELVQKNIQEMEIVIKNLNQLKTKKIKFFSENEK